VAGGGRRKKPPEKKPDTDAFLRIRPGPNGGWHSPPKQRLAYVQRKKKGPGRSTINGKGKGGGSADQIV